MRHVIRTPGGIIGAGVVGVAAVVGITLAATGGGNSNPTDPAKQAALDRRLGVGVPSPGPGNSGPPAVPGVNVPATLPPACDLLDSQTAAQAIGSPVKLATGPGTDTQTNCSYWTLEPSPKGSVSLSWSDGANIDEIRSADTAGQQVIDEPSLGQGAFGMPAVQTDTGPNTRQFTPAGAVFPYGGHVLSVYVGRTDGHARAIDKTGDEKLAVALAQKILAKLSGSGTAVGTG